MIQSVSRLRGVELGVAHKLRPIGVFASVGHGQSTRAGVAKFAKRALFKLEEKHILGSLLTSSRPRTCFHRWTSDNSVSLGGLRLAYSAHLATSTVVIG